jgi:hypothetical protein
MSSYNHEEDWDMDNDGEYSSEEETPEDVDNPLDDDEEDRDDISLTKSNDEDPLYNPKADDEDAQWMQNNYSEHVTKNSRHTDAFLHCPGCFTLLCVDCQRHDVFLNQYRAMFVKNCKVDKQREVRYKKQEIVSNKQRKKEEYKAKLAAKKQAKKLNYEGTQDIVAESSISETKKVAQTSEPLFEYTDRIYTEDEHLYEPEFYYIVTCKKCEYEVAVMDEEEVYHFHNVIASDVM